MRIGIVLLVAFLSGCSAMGLGSNTFRCGEGGVKCPSAMETYESTNGPDLSSKKKERKASEMVATVPAMGAAIDDSQWPKPVLEPAQVMRIWVAPWIDEKESLHWPSYVFTEVTPRKWSFGMPDFRNAKQLVPLQVEHRPEPAQQAK